MRAGLEGFLATRLDRPVTITALRRPTATGFSADTMIVDVETPTDEADDPGWSDRLVVQAAPTGPGLFETYDLARSFAVQQELANHQVPAATMHWLCQDPAWIGAQFYVMAFVDGQVPPDRPPYHREGWLFDASTAEQRRVWTSGIEAMAALHRVPIDRFSFLDPGPDPNTAGHGSAAHDSAVHHRTVHHSAARDTAGQRVEQWRALANDLGPDGEPALLRALDTIGGSRPASGPRSVHWGDAKLANMIFDRGRTAAILDWELCGLGVGEEDLAHWMAVDWFLSTGLGVDRLPGLPGPAATIAHYETTIGHTTIDVEWWFVFAMVRMGLVFQRAAVRARARKGGDGPLRPNVIVPLLDRLVDGSVWADHCRRHQDAS